MKKTYKSIFSAFSLSLLVISLLSSCDKMDDIQKKYAEREETVYLGMVDSVKSYPGFGKAKLVWDMSADPKVQQTIIYWNLRKDSIVKSFNQTEAGRQKDSIILENLPEGSVFVEFRNVNDKGETSLISSATVTVWGPNFANGLRARTLSTMNFDYSQFVYNLTLSDNTPGDSVVYSEIEYTTRSNEKRIVKIARGENSISLPNFPDGGTANLRSIFYPPQGIDTVYGAQKSFTAPKAVANRGTKITLKGNTTSRYFNYNGDLGEWNANGDLIVYTANTAGDLTEKAKYNGIVSRTATRDFFFYDADRFIVVGTNNNVYVYQFANGILSLIKTPAGADALGTGFSQPTFIPARGFFFTVESNGALKTWFAFNNATWGSPNGNQVGTGFTYAVNALFNYETLLGVDAAGSLRSTAVQVSGALGFGSIIGTGWERFVKLFTVGTKLYGMESNGDIYVFNNFNVNENYWIVNQH